MNIRKWLRDNVKDVSGFVLAAALSLATVGFTLTLVQAIALYRLHSSVIPLIIWATGVAVLGAAIWRIRKPLADALGRLE